MSKKSKLNGSVDLLADAMRQVFSEAVEGAVKPLTTEVKAMRTEMHDMEDRLNKNIDDASKTTNKNVHAQLDEHRKEINDLISTRK